MAYGTLQTDVLYTSTGVFSTNNAYLGIAKAWVFYNGSTQAILGSFNVSSVTRNGTGDYTVNYTTAMPNATYAVAVSGYRDTVGNSFAGQAAGQTYTTSACRIYTYNASFANTDAAGVSFTVFSS